MMVGGRLSGKTGGGLTASGTTESSAEDCTLSPALPEAPTVDTVVSAPFSFPDNSNIGTEMPPIPIETEGEELFSTPLKDGAVISGGDLMLTFLGFLVVSDLAFEACLTRTLAPVIVEAVEDNVEVVGKRDR